MVKLFTVFFSVAAFTLAQCADYGDGVFVSHRPRPGSVRPKDRYVQNTSLQQTQPRNQQTQPKKPHPGKQLNPGKQPTQPNPEDQPTQTPEQGQNLENQIPIEQQAPTKPINPKPKNPANPAKTQPGTKPKDPNQRTKPINGKSQPCLNGTCNECESFIQREKPGFRVGIVRQGFGVTTDYRTDRIRIYCDAYNRVKYVQTG